MQNVGAPMQRGEDLGPIPEGLENTITLFRIRWNTPYELTDLCTKQFRLVTFIRYQQSKAKWSVGHF